MLMLTLQLKDMYLLTLMHTWTTMLGVLHKPSFAIPPLHHKGALKIAELLPCLCTHKVKSNVTSCNQQAQNSYLNDIISK